jgi:hypothetical protein
MSRLRYAARRAAAILQAALGDMTSGARRAIVILFVLTFALAAANLYFTTHQVASNDRKFCQVITGFTSTPVARPANPRANPSRERDYLWYERFVRLGRDLGC